MGLRNICIMLALVTITSAVDFEPAPTPFVIYDEPRSMGDAPSYRPKDDTGANPIVNAFQEMELKQNSGIFFAGEQNYAAIYDLGNVTARMFSLEFQLKDNPSPGALPCTTVAKDRAEFLCQNYITTIQPLANENAEFNMILCGTNGLVPVCYQCKYDKTQQTLECPAADNGEALCSTDGSGPCYYTDDAGVTAHEPLQDTAWLYLNDATLGEVVFAGANENQNQDSVISRVNINSEGKMNLATVIKTDKDDTDWLNNADFIGDPIEYEEHMYYFFRETATEYINAGKIVYSRVGRVCKNDTGGEDGTMLDNKWTTFQKARLNCSTQGDFPFYFNELQDIYQSRNYNKEVIYATFSTAETGATGSAVCVYRLDEIKLLFDNGAFKGARTPAELWLPLSESEVPRDPRPGRCNLPQKTSSYDFIKRYPLMDPLAPNTRDYTVAGNPYNHISNSPLAILQNQRIAELVVDEMVVNADGGTHDVFFLATDKGKIFKLYMADLDDPVLIEEYDLGLDTAVNEEVVSMKLMDKKLYMGTTERLVQVPVESCDSYPKCYLCVQAQDPYCSYQSSCVSETNGGKQCLRETRDKKPFECPDGCNDWPRPMIAFASENETIVKNKPDVPLNLYFTATGPKYSDLHYEFECTCVGSSDNCTGLFESKPKYQRLDKVEWVSVRFTADNWIDGCDEALVTYIAIANGERETRTSKITVDSSDLIDNTEYLNDIKNYDNMMAGYKYQVKMWEEDAIKECYPDDVSTCAP